MLKSTASSIALISPLSYFQPLDLNWPGASQMEIIFHCSHPQIILPVQLSFWFSTHIQSLFCQLASSSRNTFTLFSLIFVIPTILHLQFNAPPIYIQSFHSPTLSFLFLKIIPLSAYFPFTSERHSILSPINHFLISMHPPISHFTF